MAYYWQSIYYEHIPFSEILYTFISATKLDVATASYLLIIPFFLLVIWELTNSKLFVIVNNIYVIIALVVYLLISAGEMGIYDEWKSKLSYRALTYLRHPDEVYNSISSGTFFLLVAIFVFQILFFSYTYRKLFSPPFVVEKKKPLWLRFGFILLIPVLLFVGLRGGVGEIPITSSDSYFSKHDILNAVAVNNGYNLTFSLIDYYQAEEKNNLFKFMPDEEARKIVDKLHHVKKDTTINILNTPKPNIVLILLESWSGDVIETLSGDVGITPEFHQLEKEGLFFTHFYASGNRSQQALASVFSGLPGLPITTLTDNQQKYKYYPSLIKDLNKEGYHTSFYFAGDMNYGNIRSYLLYNDFESLIDENGFTTDKPKGKLGYHDEVLFDRFLHDLPALPQPYLIPQPLYSLIGLYFRI